MKELAQVIYAFIKLIIREIKILQDTHQTDSDVRLHGGKFEIHHQNQRKTKPISYHSAKLLAKLNGGSIIHVATQTLYDKEIIGVNQDIFEEMVKNKDPAFLKILVDE